MIVINMFSRILYTVKYIYILIFSAYYIEKYQIKDLIDQDFKRYCDYLCLKRTKGNFIRVFLNTNFAFRDVFYFRCKQKCSFLSFFFHRYPYLYIDNDINAEGGAFLFHHPQLTYIKAKSIGYGCEFRQSITIKGPKDGPIIGRNVQFGSYSCVSGDIAIHDDVYVSGACVIFNDIPRESIVVGNPSRILKKKNNNTIIYSLNMRNLAILSPSCMPATETFVKSHSQIKAKITSYYGDLVPRYIDGKGLISIDKDILKHPKELLRLFKRINVFELRKSGLSIFEYLFAKSLKREHIDVVLAEYGTTGASVTNACKWAKIPLVTHFHGRDASCLEVIEEYKDRYKKCFDYSSLVIGVSKAMCDKLVYLGCPKDNIVYCPCAPDESFYNVEPKFTKKQFFFVGRFVEKKAPYVTIFAFSKVLKKHPDMKLLMGGNGPLLGCCKSLVKMLGIENNVEFLGQITQDQIKSILSESFAYVQHSVTAEDGDMEGTPVAVMEASAAGVPVISTRHAGIPDVIIDGETGLLCDEYDTETMADNMSKIVENPVLRSILGTAGKSRMKCHFSKEQQLRILTETINKATL